MVKMKVLVVRMMVMMILTKSSAMMMTMAMISHLREGIFPVDFCLSESFSLSGVFRPTEAAVAGAKWTCSRQSLCVVNDQPVGNPKRKV
jgi:hypothetical protein